MFKLTLKQCAYLVAVAEQGGIAQAARELHISQPAVAQGIGKIEQTWGLQLFVRHHARGAELTPQGRAFVRSARRLLQQAEQTELDAQSIAAHEAGIIRFGCFHTIAPYCLARAIREHRTAFPDVDIEASELLQDEIVSGIETGLLDLALTYDMSLESPSLQRQEVTGLKPQVLLGERHPLAGKRSIALTELADEPYVMFDGPSSRDYFADLLASAGISPPIAVNSKSMESVRSAVANDLGFSLSVMRLSGSGFPDSGRVVSIPIAGKVEPLAIVLLRKSQHDDSDLIGAFAESCISSVKSAFG